MSDEVIAAQGIGLNWTNQLWSSDIVENDVCKSLGPYSNSFIIRRLIFFVKVKQALQVSDVLLLRYMPLDIFTLFFAKSSKQKIVIVYHTLRREYLQNIRYVGRFIALIDDVIQNLLKRKVLGIVCVTTQILDSEIGTSSRKLLLNAVYPNAVNLNRSVGNLNDNREGKIKIAFVASQFYYWNGLELLLNDFQDEHGKDVELTIVGKLTSSLQHKLVRERPSLIKHINYMSPANLSVMYSKTDLSLGAFCLDKIGLTEACTLKVRESLVHGVAVYSGHKDTVLSKSEFYFEGKADANQIIEVAKKLRSHSKATVFEKSKPFIDKNVYVKQLIERINEYL